jgi:hypothetical protein
MTEEEFLRRWEIYETYDPRCPACDQVHPRKKCNGVWVEDTSKIRTNDGTKDCKVCEVKGKGIAIPLELFLRGMKRRQDDD